MNVFGAHLLCDVGGGKEVFFFFKPDVFKLLIFFFTGFFSSGQTAEKTSGFLFCKIFFSRDMCTCSNNKPKKTLYLFAFAANCLPIGVRHDIGESSLTVEQHVIQIKRIIFSH